MSEFKFERKPYSSDQFFLIIESMPKPCIEVANITGPIDSLKVRAWNANGVCRYHATFYGADDINDARERLAKLS